MHNLRAIPPFALLILGSTIWSLVRLPTTTIPAPAPTATAAPMISMPPQESWIIVDLPPDATQLQYGAEIWRLVCSACHAYDGQGLTDAWRATWGPQDRNCWQSKC